MAWYRRKRFLESYPSLTLPCLVANCVCKIWLAFLFWVLFYKVCAKIPWSLTEVLMFVIVLSGAIIVDRIIFLKEKK